MFELDSKDPAFSAFHDFVDNISCKDALTDLTDLCIISNEDGHQWDVSKSNPDIFSTMKSEHVAVKKAMGILGLIFEKKDCFKRRSYQNG